MTKPADGRQLASELSSLVQQSNTRARFMRQAGSRITLQASFSLTSRGHELSSRSPPDARSLKSDAHTGEGATFASRLLANARAEAEEEARLEAWKARYLTPVADYFGFRKYATRLAASRALFREDGCGWHVFCCISDVDRECLAQVLQQ